MGFEWLIADVVVVVVVEVEYFGPIIYFEFHFSFIEVRVLIFFIFLIVLFIFFVLLWIKVAMNDFSFKIIAIGADIIFEIIQLGITGFVTIVEIVILKVEVIK